MAQNNYFHVKIGFRILTTVVSKTAIVSKAYSLILARKALLFNNLEDKRKRQ